MENFIFSVPYFMIGTVICFAILLYRVHDRNDETGIYQTQGDFLFGLFGIILIPTWPVILLVTILGLCVTMIAMIPVFIIKLLSFAIYGK